MREFELVGSWNKLREQIARMTRRDDAEDLLHDAWVGLKQREVEARNPTGLLMRAAANFGIDAHRRESRWARMLSPDTELDAMADGMPLQDEVLIARQRLDRLRAGIALLSPRTREIFLKHRLEGLKYREIAQELGISQSAVEKHIARAMTHLIEWMESW
ncbi:sigma-70 family RNA polymerase sigma factor [Novosphingobium sp. RD2P27]|uniref:Sigma-70 family RNA polymerase sigma factor n=1 Tax=Novosphingobium kalidii TaxID=3230299 RepID=A0ABV2D2L8_9SPHN